MHIGERSKKGAQGLWENIPDKFKSDSHFYTDFWESYDNVIPPKQHTKCSKSSGKTSYIERFNNTMRQRCSRLVRKTLSFSKKLENHIGAIWNFIHHYNSTRLT